MAAIEYDANDDEMLEDVEETAAPAPRLRSKVAPAKKQKGRGFKSERDEEAAPPYTGGRYESLPAASGAGPLKCAATSLTREAGRPLYVTWPRSAVKSLCDANMPVPLGHCSTTCCRPHIATVL